MGIIGLKQHRLDRFDSFHLIKLLGVSHKFIVHWSAVLRLRLPAAQSWSDMRYNEYNTKHTEYDGVESAEHNDVS